MHALPLLAARARDYRSLVTFRTGTGESFRFRSPLHVAMQLGPSHSPARAGDPAYGL
jgi:hypothetical protein